MTVIRIRMGDFIPADIKLLEGNILVDRSALTGESLPVELTADNNAFSGSIVKRGEATGIVTATGKRSFFGKTAELVRSAKSESHFEKTVLNIVEYLISIDIFLVVIILIYSSVVRHLVICYSSLFFSAINRFHSRCLASHFYIDECSCLFKTR